MDVTISYAVADYATLKIQLLNWASRFNSCCFLDNHLYHSPWQQQECLLAAGVADSITAPAGRALHDLQAFLDRHAGRWIFGHLGFGLQAETEGVDNQPAATPGFADLFFFVPRYVIKCNEHELVLIGDYEAELRSAWQEICSQPGHAPAEAARQIAYRPLLSRDAYCGVIRSLQDHIRRGDCYEINFCQEFVAEEVVLHPVHTYLRLSQLSPNPFSCFYRQEQAYLACASPERYLMRSGTRVISQPIKGTAARDPGNMARDDAQRQLLRNSAKDQRENVMVVDLVRNDLAKVCRQGSVRVEELFGIYTYPQVHQMISTVAGEVDPSVRFTDLVRATFPMGSMTGAPKRRVLELIKAYEVSPRGLFSGSVGYLDPSGNFDFNVVIRSLVYQADIRRLSFHVGSGITWYSQPEMEYEECLWKAAAIEKVLQG